MRGQHIDEREEPAADAKKHGTGRSIERGHYPGPNSTTIVRLLFFFVLGGHTDGHHGNISLSSKRQATNLVRCRYYLLPATAFQTLQLPLQQRPDDPGILKAHWGERYLSGAQDQFIRYPIDDAGQLLRNRRSLEDRIEVYSLHLLSKGCSRIRKRLCRFHESIKGELQVMHWVNFRQERP